MSARPPKFRPDAWLAALALTGICVISLGNVIVRYTTDASFAFTEEYSVFLLVVLTFAGAAVAARHNQHIRIELIEDVLPPSLKKAVFVLQWLAGVTVMGITVWYGSKFALEEYQWESLSPGLGLPNWIPFALFALGGGLVMLFTALRMLAGGRFVVLAAGLVLALAGFWAGQQGFRFDIGLPSSMALGLIVLLGLLVAAPLPHAFLAAAFLVVPLGSPLPEPAMVNSALSGMMKFLLLAIPFFLLAGVLLTRSGVATRLVAFADSLVGHMRGGLAQTTLLTNVLFSGASGSSIASAAFGATTFQPELEARGYPPAMAGAIIASTSVLDNVIPPSIAFLILATATNLSVGQLLVGGLWGGLVLAAALFIVIRLTCRDTPISEQSTGGQRGRLALRAVPAFGLGLIVVFGIRLGFVTTTEAAAIAALYTFVLSLIFGVGARDLFGAFRQAATEAAAIALLIAAAAPFAFLLAVDNISGTIAAMAGLFGNGPVAALVVSAIILFLAGLVLDIGAAILLFGPLLLPIATAAGLDPIQFGVVMVVNLMIGGLTPPFGVLIFVVSGVTRIPTGELFPAALPHVAALCGALLVISLFALSWTWLH